MKKQSWSTLAALGLAIAILCGGCASPGAEEKIRGEGDYLVYFAAADGTVAGKSQPGAPLDWERRSLPTPDAGEEDGLLELLLSGPESGELVSPFPEGTRLLGWSVSEGQLRVDLSEAYGGLNGVELTLADGCIVLTLCQLERVKEVYITVEGRPRPFRDQVLTPEDFLFDSAVK